MVDTSTVDMVCLAVRDNSIKVRRLADNKECMLRPSAGVWNEVPGEVVSVRPHKEWTFGRTLYIAGDIVDRRVDLAALRLVPLGLFRRGDWDMTERLGEREARALRRDPLYGPVLRQGSRPAWEMEQIIPGYDYADPAADPIFRAVEHFNMGDVDTGYALLEQCIERDIRCLDGHAHLGLFTFRSGGPLFVEKARRHYQLGVSIGDLTIGEEFTGVLPWGWIDNRPFLRCLHGLGLCLWRLNRPEEARRVFERLFRLNPDDNLEVRFLLHKLDQGLPWEACEEG